MPRPTVAAVVITEDTQQWDSTTTDAIEALRTSILVEPFPPASFADLSALNAAHDAADYEHCVAVADGVLYLSNGSSWIPMGTQAPAVADLALSVSMLPTQGEVQTIADKLDELLVSLRTGGALAP